MNNFKRRIRLKILIDLHWRNNGFLNILVPAKKQSTLFKLKANFFVVDRICIRNLNE